MHETADFHSPKTEAHRHKTFKAVLYNQNLIDPVQIMVKYRTFALVIPCCVFHFKLLLFFVTKSFESLEEWCVWTFSTAKKPPIFIKALQTKIKHKSQWTKASKGYTYFTLTARQTASGLVIGNENRIVLF